MTDANRSSAIGDFLSRVALATGFIFFPPLRTNRFRKDYYVAAKKQETEHPTGIFAAPLSPPTRPKSMRENEQLGETRLVKMYFFAIVSPPEKR